MQIFEMSIILHIHRFILYTLEEPKNLQVNNRMLFKEIPYSRIHVLYVVTQGLNLM